MAELAELAELAIKVVRAREVESARERAGGLGRLLFTRTPRTRTNGIASALLWREPIPRKALPHNRSFKTMIFITHIRLSPPANDHKHITSVRWKQTPSGKTGESTTAQMVGFIDGGKSVQVTDGARAVSVAVVRPVGGDPHLRTYADGKWSNNLLALPHF